MKYILVLTFCLLVGIVYADCTGVIDKSTGDLLRAGHLSTNAWFNDGSFNSTNEIIISDVPHTFYTVDNPGTNGYYRYTNSVWIFVSDE